MNNKVFISNSNNKYLKNFPTDFNFKTYPALDSEMSETGKEGPEVTVCIGVENNAVSAAFFSGVF